MKTTINAALFALLISMTSVSFAEYAYYEDETISEGDIVADLFLARPLGLVGTALGVTIHTVGLLFSVPGENFGETAEILVEDPLIYTFNRPLGHFEDR